MVDRLFFKGKYDYRDTLKNLSQHLGAIIELDQLLSLTFQNITNTLKVDKVSIYLLEEDKNCFRAKKIVEK